MSQPESRLQKKIREALEAEFPDSWWVKIHGGPFQRSGIPDLLGCVDGLFFGFEVKRPGEEATALQANTIVKLNLAKATACVVRTPEEAVNAVRDTFRRLDEMLADDPAVRDASAMQRRVAKLRRP